MYNKYTIVGRVKSPQEVNPIGKGLVLAANAINVPVKAVEG